MANILSDLKIKSISMVKKGSKPVNHKAKSLFVKMEKDNELKGGNGTMGLLGFLKQFKPELEKAIEEVEKSETVSDVKPEAEVQFVTKAEFTEKMDKMESFMKDIKDTFVQKATAEKETTTAFNNFITEFATAYKKDTEDMKASFAKAMADFKREQSDKANQAFSSQLSPEDLLVKANDVNSIFNSEPGQLVSNLIEKGATDGKYKVDVPPSGKSSFQQVFIDMQTGGGV